MKPFIELTYTVQSGPTTGPAWPHSPQYSETALLTLKSVIPRRRLQRGGSLLKREGCATPGAGGGVMTARIPCPPAPGPLEAYAAQFDDLFTHAAQRRNFRDYLAGLLLPRDRNKTLTGLAGAEPIVQAHAASVQRLQFFVSEAAWDAEA